MKYNGCNLGAVLEEHKKYIDSVASFYSGDPKASAPDERWKADFGGCVIRDKDFVEKLVYSGERTFDLRYANFRGAVIDHCNFRGFDLSHSDFNGAIIKQCNFSSCDLSYSDFVRSQITVSNFAHATLHYINATFIMLINSLFESADLSHSDMQCAMIYSCPFNGANLDGTRLGGTSLYEQSDLSSANITDETEMPFVPMKCPSEGSFIGWKIGFVKNKDGQLAHALIKLEIPKRAKRTGYLSNKCRCSEAKVLDITEAYHPRKHYKQAVGFIRKDFVYTVGRIVRPEFAFNDNKWLTCGSGIHFFTSKEEAINYI